MLGLISPSHPQFPIPFLTQTIPNYSQNHTFSPLKFHTSPKKISIWRRKASENGGGGGGAGAEKGFENNNDGENDGGGGGKPPKFNLKWLDLLVDRDPDNIVAVALTGLLAWASLQVLGQLFFISAAILVAAIKYSFIAALLIFILITLL